MQSTLFNDLPRGGWSARSAATGRNQAEAATLAELTEAETLAVAGGLNPQPLPPGRTRDV